MAPLAAPPQKDAQEPHLVLYFDVNKTVIMHDPVQGKGLHSILNDLLTERAYGRVVEDAHGEKQWVWNGGNVAAAADAADSSSVGDQDAPVSYGRFLRAKRLMLPLVSHPPMQYPMSDDPATAKQNKKMRKVFRQDFTQPGNAGEGLASEHAELLRKLQLPATTSASASPSDEAAAGRLAAGLDDSEYFFMLPSFFRVVQFLHTRDTKFNLIFRTFGDDLDRIAQEFNCFCEGKHPFFPLSRETVMDGSHGGVDRRIHLHEEAGESPRFGTFFRTDDLTALVMGTFEQPNEHHAASSGLSFYASHPNLDIVSGFPAIHSFLTDKWRATETTLAIRDFYPFWFSKREDARAGKLMTMDPEDPDVHAMFFDDNILPHDPHIVDVRDARNGEVVDYFSTTKDIHLLHVEPLEAIQNEDFFIERFHASLASRKHKQLEKALELI